MNHSLAGQMATHTTAQGIGARRSGSSARTRAEAIPHGHANANVSHGTSHGGPSRTSGSSSRRPQSPVAGPSHGTSTVVRTSKRLRQLLAMGSSAASSSAAASSVNDGVLDLGGTSNTFALAADRTKKSRRSHGHTMRVTPHVTQTGLAEENDTVRPAHHAVHHSVGGSGSGSSSGRHDRSRSRDVSSQTLTHALQQTAGVSAATAISNKPKTYTAVNEMGVLAREMKPETLMDMVVDASVGMPVMASTPDLAKLQKEIEMLKKQAHDHKKTVKKQAKILEELQAKHSASEKLLEEKEAQVQKYKSKAKKHDELVSNLESNTTCQICMELLLKPFALPPCGHVLCVSCLQEWFRKAPTGDDDDEMHDPDHPERLMFRRKTCPCCRATVVRRPVPVFAIKAIASCLNKMRDVPEGERLASPVVTAGEPADPWEGLFPPVDEQGFDIEMDYSDGDGSNDSWDDEDDDDSSDGGYFDGDVFEYGTDSEEEGYSGDYVPQHWEPPLVELSYEDARHLMGESRSLIRRGATEAMIEAFEMHYTHSEGLSIVIDRHHPLPNWPTTPEWRNGGKLMLGWNLEMSADDFDGRRFVAWALADVWLKGYRWRVTNNNGLWVAQRLMPERDVEDYTTSDTSAYEQDTDDDPLAVF